MKPYKCPVCSGTTQVAKGFYSDDPKRTNCRACIQGVVYAPHTEAETVMVPMPAPIYPVYPPAIPYRTRPWNPYPWCVPTVPYYPDTIFGYYGITCSDKTNTVMINGLSDGANSVDTALSVMS